MTGAEHYAEAERLIKLGEDVVRKIRDDIEWRGRETRRDALGKQAMGIWAQAQVHATLAASAAITDGLLIVRRAVAS